MTTILASIVLLAVLFAAMAIGIMFGRPPIKGSCGGMSAMGAKGECEICGGDTRKCEESSRSSADAERGMVQKVDPARKDQR